MKRNCLKILLGLAILNCSILNAQDFGASGNQQMGAPTGMLKGFKPPLTDVSSIKNKYLDISYSKLSKAQKLDVYLPSKVTGKLPVIVSVHGGAFMMGDKRDGQVKPMLEGLKRGYAVVSVNYRMSGEARFPANINDVKAAIRWVRANAKKYHFDSDKIAIWGGSAGGNLSSLAGTSGNVKELEDLSLGNPTYSSRVQAVVDWFGPTNFLKMDEQFRETGNGTPNHSNADSPESKVLGNKLSEIPEIVKAANPETYITHDDPSFFIEHGTKDGTVPTQQSKEFYEKLVNVLGQDKVSIKLLEGAKHGGAQFEEPTNIDLVFKFLDKQLLNK
jgi:Esterase/lipase